MSPLPTETPISNEFGPSALEIATGLSAYAVENVNTETKTTLKIELIFILFSL
jgi:hypothetical protein